MATSSLQEETCHPKVHLRQGEPGKHGFSGHTKTEKKVEEEPRKFGARDPVDDTNEEDDDDETEDTISDSEEKLRFEKMDLYSVLNVPKEASPEEVRLAYRKLCVLYHPDKHINYVSKELAQRKFELIQRAFEVLSDPVLKMLYDLYGEQGLTENLQLISREKSLEDIRRDYEKRKIETSELERRLRTNAQSHTKATLNLSPLFIPDPYTKETFLKQPMGLASLIADLNRVSITQSVEFPIGKRDRLVLGGSIESINGIGHPRLSASYQKRLGAMSSSQFQLGLGIANYMNLAVTHHFSPFLYGQVAGTFGQTRDISILGCIFTVGRHLTKNTVATLSWKEGTSSGLHLNFDTIRRASNITTSFQLNESLGLAIKFKYGRQTSKKTRIKASIDVGLNPGIAFGAERKVSKYTYLGSTWRWTYFQGITLSLKLMRANHAFSTPILIHPSPSPSFVIFSALVPTAFSLILKFLVFDRNEKRKRIAKLHRLREQSFSTLKERKREAEEAMTLIRDSVNRRREDEENRHGLVIVEAWYGNLDAIQDDEDASEFPSKINVTLPLQSLIQNSQLHLHNTTKAHLIGFYDPCIGEPKKLQILYRFKGNLHSVTIDDMDSLACPLRAHLIPSTDSSS